MQFQKSIDELVDENFNHDVRKKFDEVDVFSIVEDNSKSIDKKLNDELSECFYSSFYFKFSSIKLRKARFKRVKSSIKYSLFGSFSVLYLSVIWISTYFDWIKILQWLLGP